VMYNNLEMSGLESERAGESLLWRNKKITWCDIGVTSKNTRIDTRNER
jgi:hypothetical protein